MSEMPTFPTDAQSAKPEFPFVAGDQIVLLINGRPVCAGRLMAVFDKTANRVREFTVVLAQPE